MIFQPYSHIPYRIFITVCATLWGVLWLSPAFVRSFFVLFCLLIFNLNNSRSTEDDQPISGNPTTVGCRKEGRRQGRRSSQAYVSLFFIFFPLNLCSFFCTKIKNFNVMWSHAESHDRIGLEFSYQFTPANELCSPLSFVFVRECTNKIWMIYFIFM